MVVDKIENKNYSIDYAKLSSKMTFKSTKKVLSWMEEETTKLDNDEWTLQFLWYSGDWMYKKFSYTLDSDCIADDIIFMMKQLYIRDSEYAPINSKLVKIVDENGKQYKANDCLKKWCTVNIFVLNTDVKTKSFWDMDKGEELMSSVQWESDRKVEREQWYTLSEKDFKDYFEWDNFQQCVIGNCRLLAWVDSITHLGNYKDLIMKSVKKTEDWFLFRIPLWSNSTTSKYYKVNDDFDNQLNIVWWNMTFIVSKKKWLKALAIACGQAVTWKENFDVMALRWWNSYELFAKIFEWTHIYHDDSYPQKNVDNMLNNLYYIMNNFNNKNSLLTIGVKTTGSWLFDFVNTNDYHNHEISIERTFKDKYWNLKVVISNPRNSSKSKIISWSELRLQCWCYSFCTFWKSIPIDSKLTPQKIDESLPNREEIRNHDTAQQLWKKPPEKRDWQYATLDWIIQIEWECNDELRKERGSVTVNTLKRASNGRPTEIMVKSRWKEADIIEKKDKFIMKIQWKELEIPFNVLSTEFNWDTNDLYRMYLYAPRLSVLINRMIHDYLDDKKRDSNNNTPFSIKNWKMEFDDDPSKFSWRDWRRRRSASLVWDDTIMVLENRSKLWIKDNNFKYKVAEYLNSFCV